VLFTTEQERLLARRSFWLYRARERVAPFGIAPPPADEALQRQAFAAAFPQLVGKPLLLSLARLHEKKGLDQLISALATVAHRHPTLQLMLAGPDGGCLAALRQQAAGLGLADRVHFPGLLQGKLKWGALRHCSLFCLPSHQENFGIAVVEALSCSTPVLLTHPVNIAADIAAAGAGLVEHDTVAGITTLLRRWLALDLAARATMATEARRCFLERYEITNASLSITRTIHAARLQRQLAREGR
jgi:glycosyltransferase involved in cell wall biosynthesis